MVDREVELTYTLTGMAIREYLMKVGEGSPYGFYRCFKKIKKKTSYDSVRRYFWFLRKLGLIEFTRMEKAEHGWPKRYYRIVSGKEDDPAWLHPQATYYPITRLGGTRYRKWKEKMGMAEKE